MTRAREDAAPGGAADSTWGPLPRWVWILVALGLGLRVVVAITTLGTNDVQGWESFAQRASDQGIGALYRSDSSLNHPPPMIVMARAALAMTQATGVRFNVWLCLPAVAGDLLAVWLLAMLWRRRGRPLDACWAVLALAWGPANLLVSGYHGNTDPLCVALVLLSAWAWDAKRHAGWAGLAFAAAVNVKIIPLIALPALVADADRRRLTQFAGGALVGLIPFAVGLALAGPAFLHNVFGYGSQVDRWGIPGLLLDLASHDEQGLTWVASYAPWGKLAIVGGCLAWAGWTWRTRRHDASARVLGCFLVFLVFAPGFGIQYTVYGCALLLAVDARLGTAYAVLAGALVACVYWSFRIPGAYLATVVTAMWPPLATLLGFLAWGVLVAALYRLPGRPPPRAEAEPSA